MTDLKAKVRAELTDHLGCLHEEQWTRILDDTDIVDGVAALVEDEVDRRVKETLADEKANAS